jgi:hypothetical protein
MIFWLEKFHRNLIKSYQIVRTLKIKGGGTVSTVETVLDEYHCMLYL